MSLFKMLQKGYIIWKNQTIQHAHKKHKLTKLAQIYVCNINTTHCTILYDLVFHLLF